MMYKYKYEKIIYVCMCIFIRKDKLTLFFFFFPSLYPLSFFCKGNENSTVAMRSGQKKS
jgi:hypothetical protein